MRFIAENQTFTGKFHQKNYFLDSERTFLFTQKRDRP